VITIFLLLKQHPKQIDTNESLVLSIFCFDGLAYLWIAISGGYVYPFVPGSMASIEIGLSIWAAK